MNKKRENKKGKNYIKNRLNWEERKINSKKMTKIVQYIESHFF